MTETRKLAAILVADVVGFSRLAGADEERLLARLRGLRSDLIDPTIAVHKGRVVKRTSDGAIVEFRSAVDAVRCAIEVQDAMVERNAGVPEDRRIVFRMGIHVGDVVEESDGDLMGDGVNIAARLEGVALPGAICLSEDAYRQVKARLALPVTDMGETKLKNISEPIRAYSLQVGARETQKPAAPAAKPAAQERPSIAALPFQNMSGDAEQEYFVDGLVEDILTGLARVKSLTVIARNSSFTYKGKAVDIRQVGRELGARYVLEGSVRKGGNRLRITAQLIEAETGAHVWADRSRARSTICSTCRTRSPSASSASSSRACSSQRSSARGASRQTISRPTTFTFGRRRTSLRPSSPASARRRTCSKRPCGSTRSFRRRGRRSRFPTSNASKPAASIPPTGAQASPMRRRSSRAGPTTRPRSRPPDSSSGCSASTTSGR